MHAPYLYRWSQYYNTRRTQHAASALHISITGTNEGVLNYLVQAVFHLDSLSVGERLEVRGWKLDENCVQLYIAVRES